MERISPLLRKLTVGREMDDPMVERFPAHPFESRLGKAGRCTTQPMILEPFQWCIDVLQERVRIQSVKVLAHRHHETSETVEGAADFAAQDAVEMKGGMHSRQREVGQKDAVPES